MNNYNFAFTLNDGISATINSVGYQFAKAQQQAQAFRNTIEMVQVQQRTLASVPIIGLAATVGMQKFGTEVIETLSKFEKFQAVLSNTLGSKSAAIGIIESIKKFAANTPYQVDEVIDAYVRLQNRGLQPNMKMLEQIGDLAASQGKGFGQVAEAVMDAPVKQFMRLQEALGVDVQTLKGSLLKLQGLGITKIIKDDPKVITQTVLELSKLPQVANSMLVISATTGGMISNLKDQMTNFNLSIGEAFMPMIHHFLPIAISEFDKLTKFIKDNTSTIQDFTKTTLALGSRIVVVTGIFWGYSQAVNIIKSIIYGLVTFEMPLLIRHFQVATSWVISNTLAWISNIASLITYSNIVKLAILIQDGLAISMFYFGSVVSIVRNRLLAFNLANIISGISSLSLNGILLGLSSALVFLRTTFSLATIQQLLLNAAMYANPIGVVIAGISLLVGSVYGLYKIIDYIFPQFFSSVKEWFTKAWNFIYEWFIQPITKAFEWLFGMDLSLLKNSDFAQAIIPSNEAAKFLANGTSPNATPIQKGLDSISGDKGKMTNVYINIQKLNDGGINLVTNNIQESQGQIKEFFERLLLDAVNQVNYGY